MHTASFCTFILLAAFQSFTLAEVLVFSDVRQFIDISTYNFYLGKEAVYEHTLMARPGKQVNLYLFTNNVKQYTIQVYDGDSATAPEIPTQAFIPKNELVFEYPDPIKSTGRNMFVRIRADQTNPNVTDFQAMATDYTQQGCPSLVTSANPNKIYTSFQLKASTQGGNCYYVVHANDVTNSPLLTQSIQTGFNVNSTKYNLYKGLYTDTEHALFNTGQWWNLHATDKYLIINPLEDIGFGYYWFITKYVSVTDVNLFTHDSLMSVDYLQDEYPNRHGWFQQDFIVRMNVPVTSVQITYLSLLGSASLTVTTFNDTAKTAEPITYTAADFVGPFNVTYTNCDSVEFKYVADRQANVKSGFYGLIADATIFPIDTQSSPSTVTDTTAQHINTTTTPLPSANTTAPPVQTTTKKTAGIMNCLILLVLSVITSLSS